MQYIPVPSSKHAGLQTQCNSTFPFLLSNISLLRWLVREPEYGLGNCLVIQVLRQSIASLLLVQIDYHVRQRNVRKLHVHNYLSIVFT